MNTTSPQTTPIVFSEFLFFSSLFVNPPASATWQNSTFFVGTVVPLENVHKHEDKLDLLFIFLKVIISGM